MCGNSECSVVQVLDERLPRFSAVQLCGDCCAAAQNCNNKVGCAVGCGGNSLTEQAACFYC